MNRAWTARGALCAGIGWAIFLCVGITQAQPIAVPAKQQHVLMIHVSSPGAPGPASFGAVYQKILGDALGNRLEIHREYIDLTRFSEPDYPAALVGFLRYKYQRLPPDVVLAVSEGAHRFIQRFRTELFPGIPTVFIDRPGAPRQSQETGISTPLDLAGTLDLALLLQPSTKRVFVVTGVSELDRRYARVAREQFQRFASRVTVTFLSDLAWADLEKTVAHLPPDSIIYFLTVAEDGAGARLLSTESGERLARVANVPIYSWNDVMMDHGIIGGRLLSNAIVAEHSAQLTLRILRGEKPDSIPVLAVDPHVPQLDWRQLRRWGISEARVPDGTTILHRELSFWDRYQGYVAGALILTLLQTTLIAGLLVQRGRRRRTELALLESQRRYALATEAGAIGVWDWNFETHELYIDPVLKSLLGFGDAEITSSPQDWGARVHPDDAPAAAARITACVAGDSDVYEIEHRMLHKDGSAKWFLSRGSAVRRADGTLQRLVGTKVDITERKRADQIIRESEAALQTSDREIRHLAGRLIEAQDAERARVARDLHDDVSQQLAGLSIAVSGVKRRLTDLRGTDDVQRDLVALQQRALRLTDTVRNLSHDLHPSVLRHSGLVPALTEYCAELSRQHGVVMTCGEEGNFADIAPDAALCLYRIAQEALRNIVAHAGAGAADVRLRRIGDSGELTITDNGKGFDPAHARGPGLGLVSITERVRLAGGTISIVSEMKKGTRLRAQVPLNASIPYKSGQPEPRAYDPVSSIS